MTKKAIQTQAKQKIKEGKSHQETFDELKQKSKLNSKKLAEIIRYIPTLKNRQKYRRPQTVLIAILCLTILFKLLPGFSIIVEKGWNFLPLLLIFPIINIILTYGIINYKGQYYRTIIIFSILSFLKNFGSFLRNFLDPFQLIDIGIPIVLIGLGFYLNAKMNGKFELTKEKYTNAQGKERLRNVVKFVE